MYNCPKCNHENEAGALFCRNCGSSMTPVQKQSKGTDRASALLFAWVILVVFLSLSLNFYTKFVDNWFEEGRTGYGLLLILNNIITIMPVLAIKNKPMKIIGLIAMTLMILWWTYNTVDFYL